MAIHKQAQLLLKLKSDHLMDFLFLIDRMYAEKDQHPSFKEFFEYMDLPVFPDIPDDYEARAEEIAQNVMTGWKGNRSKPSQNVNDCKTLIDQLSLDLLVTEKYLPNQQELTAIEKVIILHEYGAAPLSDGRVESLAKKDFYQAYRDLRYDEAHSEQKLINRSRRKLIKAIASHYYPALAQVCSSQQQMRVCLGYLTYELGIAIPPKNVEADLSNRDFKDFCRDQFRYVKF